MKRTVYFAFTAAAFAGLLAFATQASAHHSFAATYFEDKTDRVEGELVQFLLRNPHSFVHVEVKDAQGNTSRYAGSGAARSTEGSGRVGRPFQGR